jgi:hypothetical protein
MLRPVQRHSHAQLFGKCMRPHAACQQHSCARNVAGCGAHADHTAAVSQDFLHSLVFERKRARAARALDERIRDIEWIHLPVGRHELAAKHIIDLEERPALLDFVGRKVHGRHVHALRCGHVALDELQSRLVERHRDRTVFLVACALPRLDFQGLE